MGLFVVFEGVDGSGKTTQSEALRRRLDNAGYRTKLVREPGGTPTGEHIREWLATGDQITPIAELFLFSAARAALVESVVRPSIESGEVVICDRYTYSTVAYQGYGRGLDLGLIRYLSEAATENLLPDLVVLLDIPPERGFERIGNACLDRIENETAEFHQAVRRGFIEQAASDPDRWVVLDGNESALSLEAAVWDCVSKILPTI